MPAADFFTRLGLFVARDFLDEQTRAQLELEAGSAERVPAPVSHGSEQAEIDTDTRRTEVAGVSESVEALIEERLDSLKPQLMEHFSLELEGWTKPQFLVYESGDFFKAHKDRNSAPDAAAVLRRRQVSAVIFLNRQAPDPVVGAYGGGDLTFYGLLEGERMADVGLPLIAEPGLLVAFPSDVMHAVTPVTHGRRYTIVTWFV